MARDSPLPAFKAAIISSVGTACEARSARAQSELKCRRKSAGSPAASRSTVHAADAGPTGNSKKTARASRKPAVTRFLIMK